MLRRARSATLALALPFVAASPSASATAAESGIVLLVPQLAQTDGTDDAQLSGLWVELPKLAARRAGVAISDIQTMPFARIFREIPSGENYCSRLIGRTVELETGYTWLAPTQRIILSAFVPKDRVDPPRTIGDLKAEKLVAVRGILSLQMLNSLDLSVAEATNGERAVQMVLRGRASAVVLGNLGSWMAEKTGAALREAVRLWEWPGYFACSPNIDGAIRGRLGEAIKEIYARGEDRAFAAADGLGDHYERLIRPTVADRPAAEGN